MLDLRLLSCIGISWLNAGGPRCRPRRLLLFLLLGSCSACEPVVSELGIFQANQHFVQMYENHKEVYGYGFAVLLIFIVLGVSVMEIVLDHAWYFRISSLIVGASSYVCAMKYSSRHTAAYVATFPGSGLIMLPLVDMQVGYGDMYWQPVFENGLRLSLMILVIVMMLLVVLKCYWLQKPR